MPLDARTECLTNKLTYSVDLFKRLNWVGNSWYVPKCVRKVSVLRHRRHLWLS